MQLESIHFLEVMEGGGHEHLSLPPLLFLALPCPLRGDCGATYLDIVLTGAFKCAQELTCESWFPFFRSLRPL